MHWFLTSPSVIYSTQEQIFQGISVSKETMRCWREFLKRHNNTYLINSHWFHYRSLKTRFGTSTVWLADPLHIFSIPLSGYLQRRARSDKQCFKTNISSAFAGLHSSPSPIIYQSFSIFHCVSHHVYSVYCKSKNDIQAV